MSALKSSGHFPRTLRSVVYSCDFVISENNILLFIIHSMHSLQKYPFLTLFFSYLSCLWLKIINAVCFSSVYCSIALLLADSIADFYNRYIMV